MIIQDNSSSVGKKVCWANGEWGNPQRDAEKQKGGWTAQTPPAKESPSWPRPVWDIHLSNKYCDIQVLKESLIKYVAQENKEVSWLKLSTVNVYLKKKWNHFFVTNCLWSDWHEKSILYSLEKISLQEDKSGRKWSDDQRPRNWRPWQDVLTVSLEILRTRLALFFSLAYQNQSLGFFSFLALSVPLSFLIREENSYSKAFVH